MRAISNPLQSRQPTSPLWRHRSSPKSKTSACRLALPRTCGTYREQESVPPAPCPVDEAEDNNAPFGRAPALQPAGKQIPESARQTDLSNRLQYTHKDVSPL